MYTISKRFHFEASHQLLNLPAEHKCGRLHGHSYHVELVLRRSVLDEHGFVVDYGDLHPFQQYIDMRLDHRHLNDVLSVAPTAENIAKHLYDIAGRYWHNVVVAVRVSETQKTWAEYSEEV